MWLVGWWDQNVRVIATVVTNLSSTISKICAAVWMWLLMLHQLIISSIGYVDRVGSCINFHNIAQHVLVNEIINIKNTIYNSTKTIKHLGINLTKYAQDLYAENYKTWKKKEIKKDLNKCAWVRTLTVVKKSIPKKLIYLFNAVSIKILVGSFIEIGKLILGL